MRFPDSFIGNQRVSRGVNKSKTLPLIQEVAQVGHPANRASAHGPRAGHHGAPQARLRKSLLRYAETFKNFDELFAARRKRSQRVAISL